MSKNLVPIDPFLVKDNVFKLIGDDWMLITAGDIESYNIMTASWGTMGELWHKKVCICFVRPTRYTFEFMNKADHFTLSFYDDKYREMLNFCGTKSGREIDKAAACGITPMETDSGAIYFAEARLVFECKKLYTHDIDPGRFLDPIIHDSYPKKDYHRMYIGEVIRCLARPERLTESAGR